MKGPDVSGSTVAEESTAFSGFNLAGIIEQVAFVRAGCSNAGGVFPSLYSAVH